jgi:hypothetical protein
MTDMAQHETGYAHSETIHLPSRTAWPIILAFGVTLGFAGLVTTFAISLVGIVLVIVASVGWFRQVLPHEAHEHVAVRVLPVTIATTRKHVHRLELSEENRAHLPAESYPVLSGVKGGIAGGIAMIFPALLYGLIAQHSIWYPINLLGGAGVAGLRNPTTAEIAAFHWQGLLVACIIQTVACLLVGLLYGAMLPMLPRRPVLLGGIIAPLLWTGLLHSTLGVINPVLDDRISWGWFVVSQVTFGIVAGLVVARESRIRTARSLPFFARLGIEAPGLMHEESQPQEAKDVEKKH